MPPVPNSIQMNNQTPNFGSVIDRRHPLSHGLLNLKAPFGGPMFDLVTRQGQLLTGTASWKGKSARFGPCGLTVSNVNDAIQSNLTPTWRTVKQQMTLVLWTQPTTIVAQDLWSIDGINGVEVVHLLVNTTSGDLQWAIANSATTQVFATASAVNAIETTKEHMIGVVWNGGVVDYYQDGKLLTHTTGFTSNNVLWGDVLSPSQQCLGLESTVNGFGVAGNYAYCATWNRALTAADMAQIYAQPFVMVAPEEPDRRFFYLNNPNVSSFPAGYGAPLYQFVDRQTR